MSELPPSGERLDSWKAIAQYLQRDLATVRRWEKRLGLPVRRVGLTGRSVFAYRGEIDRWLATARPVSRSTSTPASPALHVTSGSAYSRGRVAVAGTALLAALVSVFAFNESTRASDLRIEASNRGVVARTQAGIQKWTYRFPPTFDTGRLGEMVQVSTGLHSGVYVATRVQGRIENEQVESGSLTFLDLGGRPQRSFSFQDRVTLGDKTYGPPWALTAFAVAKGATDRVAIAAHHYTWDPGLVTILDERWHRRGTFVNSGWIESVNWLTPQRLLIAGYSNAHDGGMIALLDPAALDGQGPEPVGSPHFCETCGSNRPLRIFIFPRTEINRIAGGHFNRAVVQIFSGGTLVARTIEMTSAAGDADVLYEFTAPSLDFVSAKFSDRYWELHRRLESEGRIHHTREQCPDRNGPRQILEWQREGGWRKIYTR